MRLFRGCDTEDRALACNTDEASCNSDEGRPLFVRNWTLQDLAINQTSNVPCSENTISVQFAQDAALHLACLPEIMIAGLSGTSTGNLTSVFVKRGGVTLSGAMTVKSWNSSSGALVLKVEKDLDAARYQIVFNVTNSRCQRTANIADLQIKTSRCGSSVKSGTLGPVLGLVGRKFLPSSSIRQSTPYPCAANKIIVTVLMDRPLLKVCGSKLNISGLTGSLTPDNNSFPVRFSDGNLEYNERATWVRSSGVLQLSNPIDMQAEREYTLQFTLENPAKNVTCPTVSISHVCDAMEFDSLVFENPDLRRLQNCLPGASVHDYKPLCVRNPHICGSVVQSNPYLCSATVITGQGAAIARAHISIFLYAHVHI